MRVSLLPLYLHEPVCLQLPGHLGPVHHGAGHRHDDTLN